jgi:putative ABC transport system permease protein
MLRNYFKVALRNLTNNKLYSCINIGGLGIGISVCMLIMVYVVYDWSYDRFHKNAGRIFYPVMRTNIGGDEGFMDGMTYMSGPILKSADPGIESFLRVETINRGKVIENPALADKKFTEGKILMADSNFFSFFSFPLVEGDPKMVLNRPFSMVITQKAAQKYFGDTNPVGKTLKVEGKYLFEITGIAAEAPGNSSINFDFIGSAMSASGMNERREDSTAASIGIGNYTTYLQLRDARHAGILDPLVASLAKSGQGKLGKFQYSLNAFISLHNDHDSPINVKYRRIFPLVAGLILLLALINYMSLATARSAIRAKEIGVRKILGAGRGNIVKQFYIESAMYGLLAFLLALLLFAVLRPAFYNLLQIHIDEGFFISPYVFVVFGCLLLMTIFISGSYPSLVLSSFKPIRVLYGRLGKQKAGAFIRQLFTVLQFTISVALIICSLVINRQIYFFRHTDTGMDRDQVLMIPYQKTMSGHHLAFKSGVANVPGVRAVATAIAPVFGGLDMTTSRPRREKMHLITYVMYVDEGFIPLLGLHWKTPPADRHLPEHDGQIIVNEEAVDKLNLGFDPIGQDIIVGRDSLKVCAVMKNFNFQSLHERISPLCMSVVPESDSSWRIADYGGCLYAKIAPHANIPTVLASVRDAYTRLDKTTPFQYQFLDDAFDGQYKAEDRLSKIFDVFTVLTIFIACLGLFGLASYSTAQRTKEIGIRKVLGADVMGIVRLITVNFIKPVLLSILIAMPLAWLLMEQWLRGFAYRIGIGIWIFAAAGLAALLVAVATVSAQAVKAAVANPVNSLRSE